jgi:ATP-dependent Clp protease ATP-binding subunit ClpA
VLDQYSDRARRVVGLAEDEAQALGHHHVGTEHLLLGILADGQTPAAAALDAAGATLAGARPKVVEAVGEREPETMAGEVPLTARAKRVLERASRFALQRRSPEVETEQILLAILNVDGTAGQVLRGLGVDLTALQDAVTALPQGPAAAAKGRAPAKEKAPAAKHAPAPITKRAAATKRASSQSSSPGPSQSPLPSLSPEPRCPSCGAPLGAGVRSQAVPLTDEAGSSGHVQLIVCPRCGSTLGVIPAS